MLGLRLGLPKNKYGGGSTLLLDLYPGAAAAYSLRELTADWKNQPVVRVRRSLDNAELDFTATEITDGTLVDWVYGKTTSTLPADQGAGSVGAFSLRYVTDSYSGDVVLVRRGGDNSEQAFNPAEISSGALVTFCNGGDGNGYVKTWYDQTGTGNVTNTVTGQQPQIVSGGSLITLNGKPAITFNGDGLLSQVSRGVVTAIDVFAVYQHNTTGAANDIVFGMTDGTISAGQWGVQRQLSGVHSAYINYPAKAASRANGTVAVEQVSCYYHFTANDKLGLSINGSYLEVSNGVPSINWTGGTSIGAGFIGSSLVVGSNITVQEVIFYNSNQLSVRRHVEGNQNEYYNIYDVDAYVTTWYDQSGNGRNATQTTAASQPIIVSSGTLSTLNGNPAILLDGIDDWLDVNASGNWQFLLTVLNNTDTPNFSSYEGIISGDTPSTSDIGLIATSGIKNFFSTTWYTSIYLNGINNGITNVLPTLNSQTLLTVWDTISIGTKTLRFFRDRTFASRYWSGSTQELIIYDSNQSANRVAIESNINEYYTIY